ncbi:hypothetical protein [Thiomicrorhabdus sp.]|uniref:hypothetical protein n=1 Tax=Thiomicrorhabdus sp. TaxID=2039724 RepID=UPI0029C7B57B|nr:hypothetical protein [Thiomicrorhabdus sp.]
MSTLKIERLQKELAKKEEIIAFLRLDILQRTTEFVNQQEVTFALMDYIFSGEAQEVRTLNEAKNRWHEFKQVIHESTDHKEILDKLNLSVSIKVHHDDNTKMVMDLWSESRSKHGIKS